MEWSEWRSAAAKAKHNPIIIHIVLMQKFNIQVSAFVDQLRLNELQVEEICQGSRALLEMNQFRNDNYQHLPPFASCLYHREIQPKNQNFLNMLRFTFVPYFQLYSFPFFWILIVFFVYLYSIYLEHISHALQRESEFLQVSQATLFELGENYPYYVVQKYHYYRLFTSIVLFRNLYHFLVATIGILLLASYVEQIVGFKRTFLLAVTSGVGGETIRNLFIYRASIESLTPICGLMGFLCGLFVANRESKWRYNQKQKNHMILAMALVAIPYGHLGVTFTNISLLSMAAAFLIGFLFYYCDPDQRFLRFRIPSITVLVAVLAVSIIYFFWKTSPPLLAI